MGRTVHDRLGWELDHCAIVGFDWGCENRYTGKSATAHSSSFWEMLKALDRGCGSNTSLPECFV